MVSYGIVKETFDNKAKVLFIRESACGGNCASCMGCGGKKIESVVLNEIGAQAGDKVKVETKTEQILLSAFLIYIIPILIFVILYLITSNFLDSLKSAVAAAIGFGLWFIVVKKLDKKLNIETRIIEIVRSSYE